MDQTESNLIFIHIGQFGVQAGLACWELFGLENGIRFDGVLNAFEPNPDTIHTFYNERASQTFSPRAVFIDSTPEIVDDIKNGIHKDLFTPRCFVKGINTSANLYSRGYYLIGQDLMDLTMEKIHSAVEASNKLCGFFITHSVNGGTGSGFHSALMQELSCTYEKQLKVEFTLYPNPIITECVTQPYNSVLATEACLHESDLVFTVDNEALGKWCTNALAIEEPTFADTNQVLAQVISGITSSFKYHSQNENMEVIKTHLGSDSRLHFPFMTCSSFTKKNRQCSLSDICSTLDQETSNIERITREAFHNENSLLSIDLSEGAYISLCMLYRGRMDDHQSDSYRLQVDESLKAIKYSERNPIRLTQTGSKFIIDLNPTGMVCVPDSQFTTTKHTCSVVGNHTSSAQLFSRLAREFDIMFRRRAFLHRFLAEGLEKENFEQAYDEIKTIEKMYEQAE